MISSNHLIIHMLVNSGALKRSSERSYECGREGDDEHAFSFKCVNSKSVWKPEERKKVSTFKLPAVTAFQ